MKVCLDTCAYSRLMRGHEALRLFLESSTVIFLSTVVLGELHYGFKAGTRTAENERQLMAFLALPGIRVQDVTWDIAKRYAALANGLRHAGTPLPTNDIWIAATAFEVGAGLVTYDTHFCHVPGLIVEAPGADGYLL